MLYLYYKFKRGIVYLQRGRELKGNNGRGEGVRDVRLRGSRYLINPRSPLCIRRWQIIVDPSILTSILASIPALQTELVHCTVPFSHELVSKPIYSMSQDKETRIIRDDGSLDVIDHSEFKIVSNCCYPNCCRTNCGNFLRICNFPLIQTYTMFFVFFGPPPLKS